MRASKVIWAVTASAALAITPVVGRAADVTREDVARAVKVAETAAEHEEMAKTYDQRAKEWRAEADYHTKMAAAYKASRRDPQDVTKMQKHCAAIAKDAQDMAERAQLMADYHRLRAKEPK